MKRSKIILGVGLYLVLGGLSYLFSSSPDAASPGTITLFRVAVSGLMLIIGVGLIFHKLWAASLYWMTAILLPLALAGISISRGVSVNYWLIQFIAVAVIFGTPAFLLWIRRNRLSGSSLETEDAQA